MNEVARVSELEHGRAKRKCPGPATSTGPNVIDKTHVVSILRALPIACAHVSQGPCAKIKTLCGSFENEEQRRAWFEAAHMHALLGSCPKTVNCVVSGIRCWAAGSIR